MQALVNQIIEQRHLIYSIIFGVVIVSGRINDKMNLKLAFLAYVYFFFYFLYSFSLLAQGWMSLAIGLVMFSAVVRCFQVQYKEHVELYSNNSLFYSLQWISLGFVLILLVQSISTFMVGGGYRETYEQVNIVNPIESDEELYIVDGGYGSSLNSTFGVQAKKYAIFIAGRNTRYRVVSPCEGRISSIQKEKTAGNTLRSLYLSSEAERYGASIVIKCFSFEGLLVLSNLDKNSISVSNNQTIEFGDFIGFTGSSEYRGRSGLLVNAVHTNSLDEKTLFETGEGVPILINGEYLSKSDKVN